MAGRASSDRMAFFKSNWFYLPGSLPMVEQLRWARLIQLWRVYQLLRDRPDLLAMFRRERNETTLSGISLPLLPVAGVGSGVMYWLETGATRQPDPDSLRCLLVDAGDPLYRGVRGSGAQDGGGASSPAC